MSEMIERVKKAIAGRLSRDSKGECLLIITDEQAADVARAVIEAMREPTGDMIFGEQCMYRGVSYVVPVMGIWPKMIDAALNGSKT